MTTKMSLWEPEKQQIIPANTTDPALITSCAVQLSKRDQRQIVQGLQAGNHEMVITFVWAKTMASLKKELGSLGMQFIGEMLDKPDLDDTYDPVSAVSDVEAVMLAAELGVVSSTEAIRLRHAQEMVAHLASLDAKNIDDEGVALDELEAMQYLKTCVSNVLGKPKIEVATKFAEFRTALESETLNRDDPRVAMLIASPYFFRKLTISILLSIIKGEFGAKLENALANLNTILPLCWDTIRDTERWQVGHTYAEVYAAGRTTSASGVKQALLKVKGFDYVPENLRSDTFVKAAQAVISAHEGMNNFYAEEAPVKTLFQLGSTIPTPAFAICASAVIAVTLGNSYGYSWAAVPTAENILRGFSKDRWQYFLNQCLPGDIRILNKLSYPKPRDNWCAMAKKYGFGELQIKDKNVSKLVSASLEKSNTKLEAAQKVLLIEYYGKTQ